VIPAIWLWRLAPVVAIALLGLAVWWDGYRSARREAREAALIGEIRAREARDAAVDDAGAGDAAERLRREWSR